MPPDTEAGLTLSPSILDEILCYLDVADAEFVAVIQCWRAAQGQEQHGRYASLFQSDARRNTRPVVIAENPVRPAPSGRAASWRSISPAIRGAVQAAFSSWKMNGRCDSSRERRRRVTETEIFRRGFGRVAT
jgi:hypothetical protein